MTEDNNQQGSSDPIRHFRRLVSSTEHEDEIEIGSVNTEFGEEDTRPLPVKTSSLEDAPTVVFVSGEKMENHYPSSASRPATSRVNELPHNISEDSTTRLVDTGHKTQNLSNSTKRGEVRKKKQKTLPYKGNPNTNPKKKSKFGCFLRSGFIALFVIVAILLCATSIVFYQYYRIASQLPDIQDLRENASQFETTRILDRNGNVLYEILEPNAGRRTYVPL